MSPGEELCLRVLEISNTPGVPPVVAAHLGQAVGRYLRRRGRFWAAIATISSSVGAVLFIWWGLTNTYVMELMRGRDPLLAAGFGVLGIAQVGIAAWSAWQARRQFRNWRSFG